MSLAGELELLSSAGLIRLAEQTPELEYMFRHALVQDAAYASLLKSDRRALHLAVGAALEALYPERHEELAPVLGQHFAEAGEDAQALRYFRLAGDVALRVYARAEAVLHYGRALEHARRLDADSATMQHLLLSQGRALELSGRHGEALACYADLEALARERRDQALELASLSARVTIYATYTPFFDAPQAEALLPQALELARALDDREAQARLLWNRLLLLLSTQRLAEAVSSGEEALAIARAEGLRELLALTLNDLGRAYLFLDQVERGLAVLEEARQLWRALGNLPMLAENLNNLASYALRTGAYDQGVAHAEEALRISQASGNAWGMAYSQMLLFRVYFERGRFDLALPLAHDALRNGRSAGFLFAVIATGCNLALCYGELGAPARGVRQAREMLATARAEFPAFQRLPLLTLALLHLRAGETVEAQALLDEVLTRWPPPDIANSGPTIVTLVVLELLLAQGRLAEAASSAGAQLELFRAGGGHTELKDLLLLYARALHGLGQLAEAQAPLAQALAEAEAQGAAFSLIPMLALATDLAAWRGAKVEALALRQQARAIVADVLATLPDPALRASWAALPQIRFLLDEPLS